jgi:hypothetical protein
MSKEEAIRELMAAPIVTALQLWGVRHGVYPADALPAPDLRELVELAIRMQPARP